MDKTHLNAYISLIQALLQCPKGGEWTLLQENEVLLTPDLIQLMAQVAEQLVGEGNIQASRFIQHWASQLAHLLEKTTEPKDRVENRTEAYLKLIQSLLECPKGGEYDILSQHAELVDSGLVQMMNQVAAQLATKGNQDVAIYLKHLAADVNRNGLHSAQEQPDTIPDTPVPPPEAPPQNFEPIPDPWQAEQQLQPLQNHSEIAKTETESRTNGEEAFSTPASALLSETAIADISNSQIYAVLEAIALRLANLEQWITTQAKTSDPLWYMQVLEQAHIQQWILSSEEIEQLLGVKPQCPPGESSFQRGCWKFMKVGKIGSQSGWLVKKQDLSVLTS
jgi:hypothetical protein